MQATTIAANIHFQVLATTEALELISTDTGISYKSLISQFPTNLKLQKRVAEFVAKSAMFLAKELNQNAGVKNAK